MRGERGWLSHHDDDARWRERPLESAELAQMRSFLDENGIDDLPALIPLAHDGMQYEYVHVSRDGGRRVFMNNPEISGPGGSAYRRLVQRLSSLLEVGRFETHYAFGGSVKDLELLWTDSSRPALAACKVGQEILVLIAEGEPAVSKWHALVNGALIARPAPPPACDASGRGAVAPKGLDPMDSLNGPLWQARAGATVFVVGNWNRERGLWKCQPGRLPVKLKEGTYARPIVTPDGRWLVAAKAEEDWARPNGVVRVDLNSGQEIEVPLERADTFDPVSFIPAHERVLLVRAREDRATGVGPGEVEYSLLDPASGQTQKVEGEFRPWEDQSLRALQPTGRVDEAWAAIHAAAWGGTRVGRYDTRTFRFAPLLTLPGIRAGSMDVWVDEPSGKLYLTYRGHLLCLPLAAASPVP